MTIYVEFMTIYAEMQSAGPKLSNKDYFMSVWLLLRILHYDYSLQLMD